MSADQRAALRDRVLELFNAGHTASACAEQVNVEFGASLTRSSVLGLVHRNRDRVTRAETPGAAKGRATRAAKRAAAAAAPTGQPCGAGPAVLALESSSCRWPISDPRAPDFHFCMARRQPGAPYCAKHLRQASAAHNPETVRYA